MKTKKLTIAIAIMAMTFIGTSCGNKQQKSASEATTEQSASSALEIDSLLANAESLAGQEVTIEGVCTHTCKHGAKKIFLMGSDDTQVIRVEAGTLGAFDPKCVNSIVRVTGTLKEQRKPTSRTGKRNSKHRLPRNTEPVKPDATLKRKHVVKQPTALKPALQISVQK